MLRAYHMRPQRAEVLYELAKDFRERGENESSLLFSEAGMQLRHPATDLLFVNDYVYKSGLREEFSICAYYVANRRKRGAVECNRLALAGSEQAKSNLLWYLNPLVADVPSFEARPIRVRSSCRLCGVQSISDGAWRAPVDPGADSQLHDQCGRGL